jgi:uncharacterized protein (DUF305 family)
MKPITAFAFSCLLIVAYAANAQVNTADQRAHPQPHTGHHEGMMLTGDVRKDMRMTNEMMLKHLGKPDREYDVRFIDMMIPHHEGAILMAKDALKNATHKEIKEMAAVIIKDQQKEIEQLNKWRKNWYGDP